MKKLTVKERLFCKAYLANGFNGTQAALTAGFSEISARTIAHRLLTKDHIKAYLQKRMQKMEEKLEITAEWKMKMLKECAEGCMRGQASEHQIHPSGVIGAIAELNKMQGHYSAEKVVNTNINADAHIEEARDFIKQFEKDH